ncbi:hypothetical protein GCM10011352_16310 [Marinobacterium zhoushanense]|uniref:PDZ domain-containing protein n=1 Tax=Marinobacterium zhoushanense TaxID=1679163 RepID=A0ABQ1KCG6_9GAMM|nr:M48 family metallopeptidase [Marinobacterium zhoushanense]GGB91003.1 hypothetical protein GCM10011352_16310 [Marinobacterium zhoushanense]
MRHSFKTALLFACGLSMGGCATPTTQSVSLNANLTNDEILYQQELKLRRVMEYQQRIERIGAPLLKAALPFCEDNRTGYLGLKVDNISAWPDEYRKIALKTLELDEALKVTGVTPGSAAERADVRVGDMLLAVDGKTTIGGPGAVDDYKQMVQRAGNVSIKLDLLRGEERLTRELKPDPACNYTLHVVMDNAINAYADGQNVIITSGLIRFAESDAEVAMVLAHEIAHNAMKHLEAKQSNISAASLLDILVAAYGVNTRGLFANLGGQAFTKEFEQEADYVGLYILARADVPMNGLSDFWRRMAAESPDANSNSIFRTHPISAKRTLAIEQASAEIDGKRTRGEQLLPKAR